MTFSNLDGDEFRYWRNLLLISRKTFATMTPGVSRDNCRFCGMGNRPVGLSGSNYSPGIRRCGGVACRRIDVSPV